MNSQYLHDLMRSHPQLGVAENMLNAGKWADGEHEFVKFDLPRLACYTPNSKTVSRISKL